MAASGKVLGTVTSVVGEAKATAADGTVRILQVGDIVHSDETITTSAAGAVNIALENGKMLDCGANSDLSLHESILGVATAASNVPGAPGAAAPGSVEALQQAIASGQDPSQIAPATAAGGAPAAGGAGGDGSGGTPVVIEQANSSGPITAGIGTEGGSIAFPTPEFQLLAGEEEEPAVSVSVQVQVQVQVQVDVAVSIEAGVEVLNGPAQGGVFAVSASGDAVSLLEGSLPGTNVVPFVITLDKTFDTDVQVTYQIVSGTAQTPSDYFGVLTATITIPAGQTSFTVPIDIVRDQVVEGNETFSIVLVSATNATINPDKDSASVTIFNDDAPPVANNDTNWTQEDTHVLASGNVLQNQPHAGAPSGSFADAADTDNFETPTVTNPGTYAGAHGTLVLAADGTYTYTLNNSSAAVQGLDSGETLTETFGYTITDGFNAPDSATLTVTIFGSNDVPEITVKTSGDIFASGAEGTVDEAALVQTGPIRRSNAEFVTGSFKVADTDGVDDIQTVTINGQTVAVGNLVGAVFHGSAGDMTVTAYADGVASFTYQLLHAVTHNQANQTPPDVFTLTASDGTSNSAPANVTINILDDVPSTQVTASPATSALTVDETDLGTNATANFAGDFAGGSSFGADGPGSVSNAIYTLSVNNGPTGLVDTATNQAVTLAMNGSVVEGRVSNGEGGFFVVFTVSVDTSGNVTLDQQRAVVHSPDTGPDQSTSLASANLVVLSRSATITDADGDTANASASINIGQALNFEDDAPSIDVTATQAADALVVDETILATNATANYADNFGATSSFGADGAGTINTSYSLSVSSSGVDSGIDDVATGQNVLLTVNGGVVEGRTAVSNELVFTVSVDNSGTVTLDQVRAVVHPNTGNPDDAVTLSSADLISLTRSSTITDRDGDQVTDTASISIGQALSFEDDGPSIDVTATQAADALVVDETILATNATANYADNFGATSSFGADGAGTINTSYSLSVSSSGVDSGIDDVATGQNVLLTVNGGVVEGRTAVSNELVFTVSVDNSGTVTLDQVRAVVHPNTGNPDDAVTLSSADLISLTRSSTITDRDGDQVTDTASISIGQALSFEDDGPSIDVTATQAADALVVDETILATNATANYADNFGATSSFGADGAGTISTSYSLSVSSSGVDSGIDDVATGQNVLLTVNGGVVEGRTQGSNLLVFTVSVDNSGTVTLDQVRAVVHPNAANPDDAVTLSSADLISLTRSSTITDRDGDQVTDTASISIGQALSFEDDGPAVSVADTFAYNNDESSNTGAQSFNFGSDGQAAASAVVLASTGGLPEGYALVQTAANTWKAVLGTLPGDSDPDTDLFVIVMNPADSTYTFTVLNGLPPVEVAIDIDSALAAGTWFDVNGDPTTNSSEVYTAVIEPAGDNPFRITASGVNEDGAAEIAVGNNTIGVGGDDVLQEQDDDVFILSLQNTTGEQVSFTSVVMTLQHFNENQEDFAITVTGFAPNGVTPLSLTFDVNDPEVSRVDGSEADSDVFTIDVEGLFSSITQITTEATDGVLKVIDFDLNFTVDRNVGDQAYDFLATATDRDADTASDAFTVTVLAGTSGNDNLVTGADNDTVSGGEGNDTINAGAGNDILIGGEGHDVLIGGAGSDTYVFTGSLTAGNSDTVTGFTVGAGGDVLNLHDVLPGAAQGQTTEGALSAYVIVQSGVNTTISVDADGGGIGAAVLVVTLEGVNTTLAQLLNNNQIVT